MPLDRWASQQLRREDFMKNQTLDLDERFGAEYAGHYVFSEITWAKRSRIIQKHTTYHSMSGKVEKSDFVAIQAETIWAALRTQPETHPLTLDKLQGETEGVPVQLGELLSKVVNKICGLTNDETDFLSSPSDARALTQQLPTTASAKNSDGPQPNSPSNPSEQSNSS
jgi:hypothetical protein